MPDTPAAANRRRFPRLTPRYIVFVALESLRGPHGRGAIVNISEGGACVSLDGPFDVGDEVSVRLGFAEQPDPVPAAGRIVWATARDRGLPRFGIQWTHAGPARQQLGSLIAACA
jgi:hypothetical protein